MAIYRSQSSHSVTTQSASTHPTPLKQQIFPKSWLLNPMKGLKQLKRLKNRRAIAFGIGSVAISGMINVGGEPLSLGGGAIAQASQASKLSQSPQSSQTSIITQSTASTASSPVQYAAPSQSLNTNDLPDRGAPEGREAAGTRGTCAFDPTLPELTVLSPTVDIAYGNESIATPLDITTRSHPTFQFYMPYTTTSVDAVKLTLLDGTDDLIDSIDVEVPENPGILSVTWPSSQGALSLDENYRWLLRVDCPGESLASRDGGFETDLIVEGFIRRIALTPEQSRQLDNASPLAKIRLWASFGVWNEALEPLLLPDVSGIQPNPEMLEDLLESVDLNGLSSHF